MLVKVKGFKSQVNIVDNVDGVLVDSAGTRWVRDPKYDEEGKSAAFSPDTDGVDLRVMHLDLTQLKRACKGKKALLEPTTTDELRAATESMGPAAAALAAEKPDQWFREVMIKAEETCQNPSSLAGHLLMDELNQRKSEEVPPEALPVAAVAPKEPTKGKSTTRGKLQPGGFEDTFEGKRVLLTPKQVEFMKRIGEIEEMYHYDTGTWYPADVYTECLSNTMPPTSVGAMITTLREKGVIRTEYSKVGGRKICRFQLTELGQYVYNKLSSDGVLARGVK